MSTPILYKEDRKSAVRGRFAPSPSGRMHLGNLFAALLSWLSAKSRGGEWLLRIEDIDRQRSKPEYAVQIEEDLCRMGLDWDLGGLEGRGMDAPCVQSRRYDRYEAALARLREAGLTYMCHCRRKEILATQAPHQSDGRVVYAGTCRPAPHPPFPLSDTSSGSERLYVPDEDICFDDALFGHRSYNLAHECGDFVMRRADGAWAYQLAVVVDDAEMGVNEVVRGSDLLLSAAQQKYLFGLLGEPCPHYAHLPLLADASGRRLSKRDESLGMDALLERFSPREITGHLACMAGIIDSPVSCTPEELIPVFDWSKVPQREWIEVPRALI